jgi:hypothetical protein
VLDPLLERGSVLEREALVGAVAAAEAALHDERIGELIFDEKHARRAVRGGIHHGTPAAPRRGGFYHRAHRFRVIDVTETRAVERCFTAGGTPRPPARLLVYPSSGQCARTR